MNKIAFITTGTFDSNNVLHDHYQNVYYLSDVFDLTLILCKDIVVNEEIINKIKIIRSKYKGKIGLFFFLLFRFFSLKSYDLLLIDPSAFNIFGFLSKILFRTKWVVDIWDIPFRDLLNTRFSKFKKYIQINTFKFIFKFADLYIVSIYPDFDLKFFNLNRKKCLFLKNGIILEKINKIKKCEKFKYNTVLIQKSNFFAPLCRNFGLNITLDTMKIVNETIKSKLIIIGKLNEELISIINNYKEFYEIECTGFINIEKCLEYEIRSHICLIPHEKFNDLEQIYPIKAIEYLALGKAVVYTKGLALEELIGDSGEIVEEIKPEEIAKKIISLLQDKEKIKVLEKKAVIKSFELDSNLKYKEIIKRLNIILN